MRSRDRFRLPIRVGTAFPLILWVLFIVLDGRNTFAQCIGGDCQDGFGEKMYPDSGRYIGTFQNGQRKCGSYEYPNGNRYMGCFDNNLRSGYGNFIYSNGDLFRGSYFKDERIYGNYHFKSGATYTGPFNGNNFDGMGTMRYPDGKLWEGVWENGQRSWGGFVNMASDELVLDTGFRMPSSFVKDKSLKGAAPRIFAVVVGVSDYYGNLSDLEYSDDDASVFYRYLKQAFPTEMASGSSRLLLNKEATKANIMKAIKEIFSQSTDNDFIVFYFSGHGAPGYFCPTDYISQRVEHSDIKELFKRSNAKYRLCIADACFSGSIGSGTASEQSSSSTVDLKDARIAVIMSSKPSQTSMETSSLRQGLFSYYLIRGLRGVADLNNDSYVTVGELFLYVKKIVSEKSRYEQVPVVFGVNLNLIPMARISR
jgi:hypothetical protein